jgi:hypothetical protein
VKAALALMQYTSYSLKWKIFNLEMKSHETVGDNRLLNIMTVVLCEEFIDDLTEIWTTFRPHNFVAQHQPYPSQRNFR